MERSTFQMSQTSSASLNSMKKIEPNEMKRDRKSNYRCRILSWTKRLTTGEKRRLKIWTKRRCPRHLHNSVNFISRFFVFLSVDMFFEGSTIRFISSVSWNCSAKQKAKMRLNTERPVRTAKEQNRDLHLALDILFFLFSFFFFSVLISCWRWSFGDSHSLQVPNEELKSLNRIENERLRCANRDEGETKKLLSKI